MDTVGKDEVGRLGADAPTAPLGKAGAPAGLRPDGRVSTDAVQHAPAPWRVGEYHMVLAADDTLIAKVDNLGAPWPGSASWQRRAANARLIAAAPDLLEALEKTPLRARNEDPRAFDDRQTAWLRDHYNPAIAKARGQ